MMQLSQGSKRPTPRQEDPHPRRFPPLPGRDVSIEVSLYPFLKAGADRTPVFFCVSIHKMAQLSIFFLSSPGNVVVLHVFDLLLVI